MGGTVPERDSSPKRRKDDPPPNPVVEMDEETKLGLDMGEVFPVAGVEGKVVKYYTNKVGEIAVSDAKLGNHVVQFHVNQVWVKAVCEGPAEKAQSVFLETRTMDSLTKYL